MKQENASQGSWEQFDLPEDETHAIQIAAAAVEQPGNVLDRRKCASHLPICVQQMHDTDSWLKVWLVHAGL